MSNTMTRSDTERRFRTAITDLQSARHVVSLLAEADHAARDLLRDIDNVISGLEEDRETFRDWRRQ